MKMDELWLEKDLTERLGLPIGRTGKSRTLSGWIAEGLSCIKKNGRRYFVEQDVIEFLLKAKKSRKSM